MAVAFTSAAANRIRAAVKKVESMGPNIKGRPNPPRPSEESFWAWVVGSDLSGKRYSFVRVYPDASQDSADLILDTGMKWQIVPNDLPHFQCAYESNGARGLSDKIVRMSFAGMRTEDNEPTFVFQCEQFDPASIALPIHDHRDNFNGGFAFSCYHPGTSLPQQRWAI